MRFSKLTATFALTVLAISVARADPPPLIDLIPTLTPILQRHKTPCLIAAIVDGQRLSAIGAVGIRKFGAPERVTPNDLIHLGSDTKAMTAVLIGQMIQSGQLAFDSRMGDIFPDLAPRMNRFMAAVTIRQLLDHTAGLPANAANWFIYDRPGKSLPEQRLALVNDQFTSAPQYPPGSQFLYSNVGYVVLGAILEKKSGVAWEALIREKIFEPLKMTSAGFGPPGSVGKITQPWGHTLDGDTLKPVRLDNPPVMGPCGRVHCTITDWARFISQFLQPAPDQPQLLSPEILHQLITPAQGASYAGGWASANRDWGGGPVLTHAGSNTMWFCVAWLAPHRNFAVLSATNVGGPDAAKACDEVSAALIQLHQSHAPPP
jgi:CubicO group peptidase (beta-lactamase class C family)